MGSRLAHSFFVFFPGRPRAAFATWVLNQVATRQGNPHPLLRWRSSSLSGMDLFLFWCLFLLPEIAGKCSSILLRCSPCLSVALHLKHSSCVFHRFYFILFFVHSGVWKSCRFPSQLFIFSVSFCRSYERPIFYLKRSPGPIAKRLKNLGRCYLRDTSFFWVAYCAILYFSY